MNSVRSCGCIIIQSLIVCVLCAVQNETESLILSTGYADCLLASSQHNLYDIHLLLCIQC